MQPGSLVGSSQKALAVGVNLIENGVNMCVCMLSLFVYVESSHIVYANAVCMSMTLYVSLCHCIDLYVDT